MKISHKVHREFEIPYQFNLNLIKGIQLLNIQDSWINCFYMAPYPKDYETVVRTGESQRYLMSLSKNEYIKQVEYLNQLYPNKLQLLLQRIDGILMSPEILKFCYNLGFTKFCVGSAAQAEIIKNNFDNVDITGSITMHINKEKLEQNSNYKDLFKGFVLDFSFCRHLNKIKELPTDYKYIILANSQCNSHCEGDRHWWANKQSFKCPGLIKDTGFSESTLIRPMDLFMFDKYISVYKLQDRSWPVSDVLRDLVLYTTQYNAYDGIVYSEKMYNKEDKINDL